jgi:hypothetical protein
MKPVKSIYYLAALIILAGVACGSDATKRSSKNAMPGYFGETSEE